MEQKTDKSAALSPDRLWAEQLAIGLAVLCGLLIFMALFHPSTLSVGAEVLGPNYLGVYGWASIIGILLQIIFHEAGSLLMAKRLGLPLHYRIFGFGANCTATLEYLPRRRWIDAQVGFAGPLTGTILSLILTAVFYFTNESDKPQIVAPFFLGMACVGFFYNLITLIPILDLEGGWIAPAIAPQSWLFGIIAIVLVLSHGFNLALLCVVSFALPRLILLITARAPRLDTDYSKSYWLLVNFGYFILVIALAMLGTWSFDVLPDLVRDTMGD